MNNFLLQINEQQNQIIALINRITELEEIVSRYIQIDENDVAHYPYDNNASDAELDDHERYVLAHIDLLALESDEEEEPNQSD